MSIKPGKEPRKEKFSTSTVLDPSVGPSPGWTLLTVGLLQLKDPKISDKSRQKVRILSSVSWISASRDWGT